MKKYLLLFFCFVLVAQTEIFSQELVRCSTTEYMQMLMDNDPTLAGRLAEMENRLQDYIQNDFQGTNGSVIVIPTVVHVIWHTASQNISDEMVESQIRVLNEDFRRKNSDTVNTPAIFEDVAGDSKIEFRLATVDPDGNPTTGITRTFTNVVSFPFGNSMKFTSSGGHDAWDATRYLNIWVCNLSGGLLGFAQFPGGNPATDGVVILYSAFGYNSPLPPYNLGRTTTHEIGHWLNLYHIWGDDGGSCSGSDLVDDTPNQGPNYFGCPANPFTCSSTDMVQNYMDYTDDACMNIYTIGQGERMESAYNIFRPDLDVSIKQKLNVTATGVDYDFTDWNGNVFATLNFDNLGTVDSVEVEVFPEYFPPNQPDGTKAVKRYFEINANGTGFTATLTVHYDDSEVIGFNNGDSNLMLFRYNGSGWELVGGTVNTTENTVTVADVSEFSTWAIADPNDSPIPVELTSFSASVIGASVELNWSTATEVNNLGFEIERSVVDSDETGNWQKVAFVPGHGSSTQIQNYSYTDKNITPGNYNYRLKIVDLDGTYEYSSIVNSLVTAPANYSLDQNFPNPFNPSTKIKFNIAKDGFVTLKVYDVLGNEVSTLVDEYRPAGAYEVEFHTGTDLNLSSGLYIYRLSSGDFVQTKKMLLLQ